MSTARILGIWASCLILSAPLPAATVCVRVVETGIPEDAASVEMSAAWEAGLMAAFFDAGHIVTNGPVFRMQKTGGNAGPALPDRSFGTVAAREGGADILTIVVLDYENVADVADGTVRPSPRGVAYRILDLGSGAVIAEGVNERRMETLAAMDEAREAGTVARVMMARLKER